MLGGGHYVAYSKNQGNAKWYCYNDSSCKVCANLTLLLLLLLHHNYYLIGLFIPCFS